MPLSRTTPFGNGSIKSFPIPFDFLSPQHIVVEVNGTRQSENVQYTIDLGTRSVVFGTAPANGAQITIARNTPRLERMTNFSDGAVLTETDLDLSHDQLFFVLQEALDDAEAANSKLVDVGNLPTLDSLLTISAQAKLSALDAKKSAADANVEKVEARVFRDEALAHATDAYAYRQEAIQAKQTIEGRMYGPRTADPSTRPDGTARQEGDTYWNSATKTMRVFSAGTWLNIATGTAPTPAPTPAPAPAGITPINATITEEGNFYRVANSGSFGSALLSFTLPPGDVGAAHTFTWSGTLGTANVTPYIHVGSPEGTYNGYIDSATNSPVTFTPTTENVHVYLNSGSSVVGEYTDYSKTFALEKVAAPTPAPAPSPAPTNLWPNPDLTDGLTGYLPVSANLSVVSNRLRVAAISGTYGSAMVSITVVPGTTYTLTVPLTQGTAGVSPFYHVGGPSPLTYNEYGDSITTSVFEVTPTSSTLQIYLNAGSLVEGQYSEYGPFSATVGSAGAPAPAPSPTTAPAPVGATTAGSGGRPGIVAYSTIYTPASGTLRLPFQITGAQRSVGGYQSWTNEPWSSVEYAGTLGNYTLVIDAASLPTGNNPTTLVANNDAGQTSMLITVTVNNSWTASSPAPAPTPTPTPTPSPAPSGYYGSPLPGFVYTSDSPPAALKGVWNDGSVTEDFSVEIVTPASPVQVPHRFFGMHTNGPDLYTPPQFVSRAERSHDAYQYSGPQASTTWAYIDRDVAQSGAGARRWGGMDKWYNEHKDQGKILFYPAFYCPQGLNKYTPDRRKYPFAPYGPSAPTATGLQVLTEHIAAVCARYPQIQFIETWNEPAFNWSSTALSGEESRQTNAWMNANTSASYSPFWVGTPDDLADVTHAIKLGVPSGVTVLPPGWEGAKTGTSTNGIRKYLQSMQNKGYLADIGGRNFHHYTYSDNPYEALTHIINVKRHYDAYGFGDSFPLFNTEQGEEAPSSMFNMNNANRERHIKQWAIANAILGVDITFFYKWSPDNLAAPTDGSAVDLALKWVLAELCGSTIYQAAFLTDDTLWIRYVKDGENTIKTARV